MAILTREDPYTITRDITWFDPLANPTGLLQPNHRIRPNMLDDLFKIPGVVALSCDLTMTQGRLRHDLHSTLWLRDNDGLIELDPDTAPVDILRILARFSAGEQSSYPLDAASDQIDDEDTIYYRATYLANSTIISWDDIALGLDDMVGCDLDEIDYGPSLAEIFGPAYAYAPQSNHEQLQLGPLVRKDLADHTNLVNIETGFRFCLA